MHKYVKTWLKIHLVELDAQKKQAHACAQIAQRTFTKASARTYCICAHTKKPPLNYPSKASCPHLLPIPWGRCECVCVCVCVCVS